MSNEPLMSAFERTPEEDKQVVEAFIDPENIKIGNIVLRTFSVCSNMLCDSVGVKLSNGDIETLMGYLYIHGAPEEEVRQTIFKDRWLQKQRNPDLSQSFLSVATAWVAEKDFSFGDIEALQGLIEQSLQQAEAAMVKAKKKKESNAVKP